MLLYFQARDPTAEVRVKPGLPQNSTQLQLHWVKRAQEIYLGDFLIILLTKKFPRQFFITREQI